MSEILDPTTDTMGHRLEEEILRRLIDRTDLNDIVVFFRGEPGIVPVNLHPFGILFLSVEQESLGQEGFGEETGFRYFRYDGYLSIEALFKDAVGLAEQIHNPDWPRRADVPSYDLSRRLTQAARQCLMAWAREDGTGVTESPVISADGKEATVELRVDAITNALQHRPDNVSNRGNVEFHMYTRRQDF